MGPLNSLLAAATTATTYIDMSSVDFSVVMDEIVGLIPQVLPGVFIILGIRKGISFVMGMVRGA